MITKGPYFDFNGDRRRFAYELLKSWHEQLIRYEQAWRPSKIVPYVYNEQPQVGFLAIASEKLGWLPLLDFSTQRRRGKERISGRGDMLLTNERNGNEIWIEVEPANIRTKDDSQVLKDKILGAYSEAIACCKSLAERYGSPALALIVAKISMAKEKDFSPADFQVNVFTAQEMLKADFCAIHICESSIYAKSCFANCPGLVITGSYL